MGVKLWPNSLEIIFSSQGFQMGEQGPQAGVNKARYGEGPVHVEKEGQTLPQVVRNKICYMFSQDKLKRY